MQVSIVQPAHTTLKLGMKVDQGEVRIYKVSPGEKTYRLIQEILQSGETDQDSLFVQRYRTCLKIEEAVVEIGAKKLKDTTSAAILKR